MKRILFLFSCLFFLCYMPFLQAQCLDDEEMEVYVDVINCYNQGGLNDISSGDAVIYIEGAGDITDYEIYRCVSSGPNFDSYVDDGFNLSEMPYIFEYGNGVAVTGDIFGPYFICPSGLDEFDSSCCIGLQLPTGGYCPELCNISNLVAQRQECNDNNEFWVDVSFEYEEANPLGFVVQVNGTEYGVYDYEAEAGNVDLTIGPFIGDETTDYEITINDFLNVECASIDVVDAVDCDACELTNLTVVENTTCNENDEIFVNLSLVSFSGGAEGFNVEGNGMMLGNFSYEDLSTNGFVTVGPLDGTLEWDLVASDVATGSVCTSVTFLEQKCGCGYSYTATVTGDVAPNITGYIEMNALDTLTTYYVHDFLWGYETVTMPTTLSLGIQSFYWIWDVNDPCCGFGINPYFQGSIVDINPLDGNLPSLTTSISLEEDNEFYVNIGFQQPFGIAIEPWVYTGFEVWVGDESLGTYSFLDVDSISVGPLVADGMTDYTLTLINPCTGEVVDEKPLGVVSEPCVLSEASLTNSCEDIQNFTLNFTHNNELNNTFDLVLDGMTVWGTYEYADLPLTVNIGDAFETMLISDSNSDACVIEVALMLVDEAECEPCAFSMGTASNTCEEPSTFLLDFDYANPTSSTFDVLLDGTIWGSYDYADLPLTLNIEEEFETMTVKETDNESCTTEITLDTCLETSLDYIPDNFIKMYQISSGLQVEYSNSLTSIEIFDMTGRSIQSYDVHNISNSMLIPFQAQGMYLVRCYDGKNYETQKVLLF